MCTRAGTNAWPTAARTGSCPISRSITVTTTNRWYTMPNRLNRRNFFARLLCVLAAPLAVSSCETLTAAKPACILSSFGPWAIDLHCLMRDADAGRKDMIRYSPINIGLSHRALPVVGAFK